MKKNKVICGRCSKIYPKNKSSCPHCHMQVPKDLEDYLIIQKKLAGESLHPLTEDGEKEK